MVTTGEGLRLHVHPAALVGPAFAEAAAIFLPAEAAYEVMLAF